MNDNELEAFVKISDENGEISKNDIIIQVNMWISMYNGVGIEILIARDSVP